MTSGSIIRAVSSSSSKCVASRLLRCASSSISPSSVSAFSCVSNPSSSPARSFSSLRPSSLSSSLFSRNSVSSLQVRLFSSLEVKVPALGDSITEGTLQSWVKAVGDFVDTDEVIAVLETDKVSVDIRAPSAGQITKLAAQKGETVKVGALLAAIDTSKAKPAGAAAAKPAAAAAPQSAAPSQPQASAAAPAAAAKPAAAAAEKPAPPKPAAAVPSVPAVVGARTERRVQISRMRKTIAERLKKSQNTAAMLTTFNEIDMSAISDLRNKFKDEFAEKHGVKLGFMSAFVRAATLALVKSPDVNAYFEGESIVYHDFVDVSVAVATPTGLVVPVLRNTEGMGFADIELAIQALSNKARKGQIALEDMSGGTFTISNGGVYGSLMGTPIVNPPQSAILGMHGIFKRPVAVGDKIEIRPMMYVALTYDHRIIDGAGAVTFLKDIKQYIEDPQRMLLGL